MAYLWAGMFIIGTAAVAIRDGGAAALSAMLAGAGEAVSLCLELAGSYLLFCGLMGIMKKAGMMESLSRLLEKPVRFLCPGAGEATGSIALALSANMLGLGNAATPLGLAAMRQLSEASPRKGYATFDMCAFIALNSSALQLLPTGVIALRQAAGSQSPASILLPTLLATGSGTALSILLLRILYRRQRGGQ